VAVKGSTAKLNNL